MYNREIYEEDCVVHCTDKDKDLPAMILDHKPEKFMKIAVAGEIRVTMTYVERHKIYVGSAHGLEFTTKGPKLLN